MKPIKLNAPIDCCMCENTYRRDKMLIPSACSLKNRERAHRICQDCWWDETNGFANENASHECPGCVKKMPLHPPLARIKPKLEDIIELSSD
jgi:hypothetical protein